MSEIHYQFFRAGAGGVIINERGKVLAFERRDTPGAWQLPQGGLDVGEEPLDGAYREIEEETGISNKWLLALPLPPCLTVYELPQHLRFHPKCRGQVHYWFLFQFTGEEQVITLGDKAEFRNWQWMDFSDLVSAVVGFRQPTYRMIGKKFGKWLRYNSSE